MKSIFRLGILLVVFAMPMSSLFGQASPAEFEKYSMVRLEVTPANSAAVQEIGLPLDCSLCEPTDRGTVLFTVAVTEFDRNLLERAGIAYSVVIEDAARHYEQRALAEDMVYAESVRQSIRTGMPYGTMGGHYKIEEIAGAMDRLFQQFQARNLITAKWSIGKSLEGRDIYAVKISDNASEDESGSEAQVLYTALTHAREPGGMMAVFFFMHHLLENYPNDSRVKNIVENCELFFVPCVNPDGYYYNQSKYPNGGGMHRMNRNPSGAVDLNRNFGPQNLWNYPNNGSSTYPGSQTYRGKAPFSEPETQVLRDFAASRKFRTCLNYHTYSNLLIYPWGYVDQVANPKFREMAVEMTRVNGYRHGTAPDLLYPVRGVSDDWFYQEIGVYSMTPEAGSGSDGFWPSQARIFPLAKENLDANLLLAEYAISLKAQ